MKLGTINRLKVAREKDCGLFLTDGQEEVLLPGKYIPKVLEDEIDVFLYTDSEDRLVATTVIPKLQLRKQGLKLFP